jgi:hypothetical protein
MYVAATTFVALREERFSPEPLRRLPPPHSFADRAADRASYGGDSQ